MLSNKQKIGKYITLGAAYQKKLGDHLVLEVSEKPGTGAGPVMTAREAITGEEVALNKLSLRLTLESAAKLSQALDELVDALLEEQLNKGAKI